MGLGGGRAGEMGVVHITEVDYPVGCRMCRGRAKGGAVRVLKPRFMTTMLTTYLTVPAAQRPDVP